MVRRSKQRKRKSKDLCEKKSRNNCNLPECMYNSSEKSCQRASKWFSNEYIQDIDVYRFYTGKDVKLGTGFLSPLLKDNNPSFGYFLSKTTGEICINDYRIGGGDFIKFVQLKVGLNFFEAMSKIAIDMSIDHKFIVKEMKKTSKDYNPDNYVQREMLLSKANNFILGKKARPYTLKDLKYWISPTKTLKVYVGQET